MRENQYNNNLFYVCSLIECIARKSKNTKKIVVDKLGKERLTKMYQNAEVYHCENLEKVAQDFIKDANISMGTYDINTLFSTNPSIYEIGKVYKRLVLELSIDEKEYIDTLIEVINSKISDKIDDYNSSMYYENPDYIYNCYINNEII